MAGRSLRDSDLSEQRITKMPELSNPVIRSLSYSTGAASYKKQTCKQILSFAVCFSLYNIVPTFRFKISRSHNFRISRLNR